MVPNNVSRTLKIHFFTAESTFAPTVEHTFPQVYDIKNDPDEKAELWKKEGYSHHLGHQAGDGDPDESQELRAGVSEHRAWAKFRRLPLRVSEHQFIGSRYRAAVRSTAVSQAC